VIYANKFDKWKCTRQVTQLTENICSTNIAPEFTYEKNIYGYSRE